MYDPNLYAIDSNSGDVIWDVNMFDVDSGLFEPYYEGIKYTGRDGREIIIEHPRYDLGNWSLTEPVVDSQGTVYVSVDDPHIRAVNPDGSLKWVKRLGTEEGFTLAVGGNDLIYAAGEDGLVYVIDRDGEELARFKGNGNLSFPVIAGDGTLIVSDANNTVWAIATTDCSASTLALHRLEDLDGSGMVNFIDFAKVTSAWLGCTDTHEDMPCNYQGDQTYFEGDINLDLYVDFEDFSALIDQWLSGE